jgi:hypothetical protein
MGVQGIGPYAFTLNTYGQGEGAGMAKYAYVDRGWRNAYLLLDASIEYDKSICHGFMEQWKDYGGTVIGVDSYMQEDASIASQITRYKELAAERGEPEFLYLCSYGGGAVSAIRQIRAAGIDVPGATRQTAGFSLGPPAALSSLRPETPRPSDRLQLAVDPSAGNATADWDTSGWGPALSHTTHLSVADSTGMYVALTQTIGPNLGSRVMTPGLGFLYAATLGGYLGHMEPGERARSSISPLMVLQDGEPVLVLGAAGGARIISAVVQAVVRVVDQGMGLPEALAAARVHPIEGGIEMETSPGIGWGAQDIAEVVSWGMNVREVEREGAFGRIHGIWVDPATGEMVGVADPDWEGAAIAPGAPGN